MKHVKKYENYLKEEKISLDEYVEDVILEIERRFEYTPNEVDEIIEWYRDDIGYAFFEKGGARNVKSLVDSFVTDGKIKWKR